MRKTELLNTAIKKCPFPSSWAVKKTAAISKANPYLSLKTFCEQFFFFRSGFVQKKNYLSFISILSRKIFPPKINLLNIFSQNLLIIGASVIPRLVFKCPNFLKFHFQTSELPKNPFFVRISILKKPIEMLILII